MRTAGSAAAPSAIDRSVRRVLMTAAHAVDCHYFEWADFTPLDRWIAYANQAVWNVWNHTAARWGSKTFPWSGWSVNNPSMYI